MVFQFALWMTKTMGKTCFHKAFIVSMLIPTLCGTEVRQAPPRSDLNIMFLQNILKKSQDIKRVVTTMRDTVEKIIDEIANKNLPTDLFGCQLGEPMACLKFIANVSGSSLLRVCPMGWHPVHNILEVRFASKVLKRGELRRRDTWIWVNATDKLYWKWPGDGKSISRQNRCRPFEPVQKNTCVTLYGNRRRGLCLNAVNCRRQKRVLCVSSQLDIIPSNGEDRWIEHRLGIY